MAILKSTGLALAFSFFVVTSGAWLNAPPDIEVENRYVVNADSTLNISFDVTDEDGDPVVITVEKLPTWMSFDRDQNVLTGTPKLWDKGQYEFYIKADDGKYQKEEAISVLVEVSLSPQELLDSKLRALYQTATSGLIGVSAALVTPEGALITAGEGRRSFNRRDVVDPNAQYRVASITKTFTAVLCLKLAEAKLLDIDDPIAKYIDVGRIPYGKEITIRQLLNHTSGLIDHLNRGDFYTGNWKYRTWTSSDIIRYTANRRSRFAPGTNYSYSNTGYYLLGLIIEAITEKKLSESFDSWIFSPLGLQNTFYDDYSDRGNKIPGLAENSRSYEYHLSAVGTAGAIVSTPTDVAKFGAAVYSGDFLLPASKSEMLKDYTVDESDDYGLGTRMWLDHDIFHIGHTGTLMGYRSVLMYIPEKKVTIVLCTNQIHRRWYKLVNSLLRDVYWYY